MKLHAFLKIVSSSWKTKLSQDNTQLDMELLLSCCIINNYYSVLKTKPMSVLINWILHHASESPVLWYNPCFLGIVWQRSYFPKGKRLALTGLGEGVGLNLLPSSLSCRLLMKGMLTVWVARFPSYFYLRCFLETALQGNMIHDQITEWAVCTNLDFVVVSFGTTWWT